MASTANESEIDTSLRHLNSTGPSIQFTIERGNDEKMAFWIHSYVYKIIDKRLNTDVYRKPTSTAEHLSFHLHHPRSHKKTVARILFERAESLTSNHIAWDNEHHYVLDVLKGNNNSPNFRHDCLKASVFAVFVW